jgi:hypothetical protein
MGRDLHRPAIFAKKCKWALFDHYSPGPIIGTFAIITQFAGKEQMFVLQYYNSTAH